MIVGFRILISMLSRFTENRFPKDFIHAQEKRSVTNISPQPPLDICDLVASFSIMPAPGKFSHQLTAILFCTHFILTSKLQWAVNNTYITRCTKSRDVTTRLGLLCIQGILERNFHTRDQSKDYSYTNYFMPYSTHNTDSHALAF